jgi:predicted RNase H-like HicB family nuclease
METRRFTYYEEEGVLVGWLEDYPSYRTQGESLEELQENLRDILKDLEGGCIPCVQRTGELLVA